MSTNSARWLNWGMAAVLAVGCPAIARAQTPLEQLEKLFGTKGTAPAAPAKQPGYLGLVADDSGEQGRGVRVLSVRGEGPAEQAGILPGDLIIRIEGQQVTGLPLMGEILSKASAGDRVQFVVERRGEQRTVTVALSPPPSDPTPPGDVPPPLNLPVPAPPAPAPNFPQPTIVPRAALGVDVLPVSEELRRTYGLVVPQGAVIQSIRPGSAADRYGLPVGAAIVSLDGIRINEPADLVAVIASKQAGDQVEVTYYQADRLLRKQVTLAPASAAAAPDFRARPLDDPPLLLGGDRPAPAESRPALRAIERVIDGLTRGDASAPPALVPGDRETMLEAEVRSLRMQVEQLERRLADVERTLRSPSTPAVPPVPSPPPLLAPPK